LVETVHFVANSLPTNPDCGENPAPIFIVLFSFKGCWGQIAAKAGITIAKKPTDSFLKKNIPIFIEMFRCLFF